MDYIAFPHLGLELPISPELVTFELFGTSISIKWYGVIIAIGFLLAMIYGLKRARSMDVDPDRMIDVVLVSALFAFVGARLYFVLFSGELSTYLADPVSILQVWKGGLAIYGGVIAAFLTGLWMCKVRKVNMLAMFDLAALGFLIGQGIGRWGNFFNQEAFGANTDLPWGMTGNIIQSGVNGSGYTTNLPVHPTFLYESLWCLLGFVVLHIVSKKLYKFKGEIFALYIMWYGAGRMVIESLRTDSLMWGTMRISQVLAILAVVGGFVLFLLLRNRAKASPKDLFAPADGEIAVMPEEDAADAEYEEEYEKYAEETGETDEAAEEAEEVAEAEEAEAPAPAEDTEEEGDE